MKSNSDKEKGGKEMKNNAQLDVTPIVECPVELAFGITKTKDKLYCIKMIKYQGDKVLGQRTSNGTTLGHALAEAEDMLSHFNLYKADENVNDSFAWTADEHFKTVKML